ncbi:MAG: phenylalanine--tRNA ligase subunit alpha [Spirochaetaceae bacterium]
MERADIAKNLHPLEVRVLLKFGPKDELDAERLVEELGFNTGQANQALSWLSAKELVAEQRREHSVSYELTELGERYAAEGMPEERIVSLVRERGPMRMPDISAALSLENKETGSAYGSLSKAGVLTMDEEKRVAARDGAQLPPSVATLRALIDRARKQGSLTDAELDDDEREVIGTVSKKRGASSTIFRVAEHERVVFTVTKAGAEARRALEAAGVTGEEIGTLTPEMLRTGAWRHRDFRPYNINVPPARVLPGRRNPYGAYLESVKDKLTSLGFEEFDGPLVETEFWNSDALFMPQFHAARDIHDVYYTDEPSHAKEIEEPYLSHVARTHEDGWETGSLGWRYPFDRDFTRRLILRSQGTVLSAKQLPKAKIPGKYFGIVRCFRNDQIDATHLSDFYQTEGIVLGENVNLRTLLGFLRMFAIEVAGAEEVKYVPGYFPFTEPSVEVHIKHPVLGWFELGGSGIFRPEVTEPMGIHVPVLAWGLGIDRMALVNLGLDDLRELFSNDIERVRLRRRS